MRLKRIAVTTAVAGVLVSGGLAATSPADAATSEAARPGATSSAAVACYFYVNDMLGFYNVRTAKSPTASLIVKYSGTRLPVWNLCGDEVGAKYRCATGWAQDMYWVAVNYNGRKGWVASDCGAFGA
jgi:hypothetical protein